MQRRIAVRRLLVLAAVFLPSCTTPNLAESKADFVEEVLIPNPSGDVRAFRIDIEEKERFEPRARYTLSPIPVDERGLIPAQFHLSPTSAIDWVARKSEKGTSFTTADVRSEYTILVRAYRPGYLTIEIKPGEETRWLHWMRADSLEQEMAIDVLLGVQHRAGRFGWWEIFAVAPRSELCDAGSSCELNACRSLGDYGLLPGTVSKEHREVLLFAASEYERLATVAAEEECRRRLRSKASQLKRYADEITTEEFYRRQSNAASR